jgi:hypothetical protein
MKKIGVLLEQINVLISKAEHLTKKSLPVEEEK